MNNIFDFDCFNIGFNTSISLFNNTVSQCSINHKAFNSGKSKNVGLSGDKDETPRRILMFVVENRSLISVRIQSMTG